MTITPDSLRSDLAGLGADAVKTEQSADQIKYGARVRREEVNARLVELRSKVITDDGAADEYQALIAERGQLDIVLAG